MAPIFKFENKTDKKITINWSYFYKTTKIATADLEIHSKSTFEYIFHDQPLQDFYIEAVLEEPKLKFQLQNSRIALNKLIIGDIREPEPSFDGHYVINKIEGIET